MSKDADKTTSGATPGPRATQHADRQRIAAFLLSCIRADKSVSSEIADRLANDIARRIKRIVVWEEEAAPLAADKAPAAQSGPAASTSQSADDRADRRPVRAEPAARPVESEAAAAAAFDPYAFSVVVVLTKTGKDGLLKRLASIDRAEHLRKLAEAQHLAVDPALASPADLRAAIVKAAETRIANRRAAAS